MRRGRPIKYKTDDERKSAQRAANLRYYYKHREKRDEYNSTPYGRATNLLTTYRQSDRKYNRGECTIDAQWIVDNVFSGQCCHYCGETDWTKLGVNRIDNSKPHTPDNCEPCCGRCNKRLGADDKCKPVYQYNLDGLLVAIWPSVSECGRNGYNISTVSACCNGIKHYNTHKGYRWSFKPLQQACQLELKFE